MVQALFGCLACRQQIKQIGYIQPQKDLLPRATFLIYAAYYYAATHSLINSLHTPLSQTG